MQFLGVALMEKGKKYIFGVEDSPLNASPSAFDCSELTQWDGARVGATPLLPDGAWNQYMQCKNAGTLIPVSEALNIPGALLFAGTLKGTGRDAVHHVAISQGNGALTIEARGKAYGVGCWGIGNRFSAAGLPPGIDYSGRGSVSVGGHTVGKPFGIVPGSGSDSIKFLQNMLNILRVAGKKAPIKVDGVYGDQTKAAVSEFQEDYTKLSKNSGLKVTGAADAATCKDIGDWVNLVMHK